MSANPKMANPLRVLIAEDDEKDAALLLRELRRGGYDPISEMVGTPETMRAALERQSWDIILSDYTMPSFNAPAALAMVREICPHLPFIIVSGTVGEEIAVESIRAGAQDFMLKGSLLRLLPAIKRELQESAMRRERDSMREQLIISDRMASIGMLAATVAHEINNPLTVITANLDFMAENLLILRRAGINSVETLNDTEALLHGALEAAERVRCVALDLKVFSHANDDKLSEAVDVRAVLESAIRMAWNEIRHRARLVTDFAPIPPVQANEGRLGQVFLNIIVNAAQSIPDGSAAENEIRVATRLDGEQVVVQIVDTGCGIAPKDLTRIFTPFFTTKAVGVGTGLGLMISHRIVKSFGGDIAVASKVGHGTTFTIRLPFAPRTSAEPKAVEAAPEAGRPSRILVVDDEPVLCQTIARMLEGEHEVVCIGDANNALVRIRAGERFDIILSDLMMPEMSGAELYATIAEFAPDQARKMVFMTGGAFSQQSAAFLRMQPNGWIEKPFRAPALRKVISGLIEPSNGKPN